MQSPDPEVHFLANRLFDFYYVPFDTIPSLGEVLRKMSTPEVSVQPAPVPGHSKQVGLTISGAPVEKAPTSPGLPANGLAPVVASESPHTVAPPDGRAKPAWASALPRLFVSVAKRLGWDGRREKRPGAYRLAVYGRHSAGKTCTLAAMAMNRMSNPRQLTCTWIPRPPWYPEHDGASAKPNDDDPAIGFQLGREWLQQAIHELRSGLVPTSNRGQTRPLRFAYWLTSPERGTVCVELTDYSGELIDLDLTHDRMATALRRQMQEMDGFLVLAEAPRPQGPPGGMSEEVQRLVQAFGTLGQEKHKGPRWDVPVALLVNKWDRRGPLDGRSVDDERSNLIDFLNSQPEPPHQVLATAIRNSVGLENFEFFPVSAFGESELAPAPDGGQIERPKQATVLKSFGLEDGFVWAVHRADAVALLQQ
jgi:hypothetical protein